MELRQTGEEKPPDHRVAMGRVVEGHQQPPGGDNPGNPILPRASEPRKLISDSGPEITLEQTETHLESRFARSPGRREKRPFSVSKQRPWVTTGLELFVWDAGEQWVSPSPGDSRHWVSFTVTQASRRFPAL